MINRRTMLRGGAAAFFGGALPLVTRAQTPVATPGDLMWDVGSGAIGLKRAEWETRAGEPAGEGPLFTYANPLHEGSEARVRFGNGIVEFVGFDYPEPIALDAAIAQVYDATPVDAVHIETTAIPGGEDGHPAYLAWFFQSPRLPDIANDRGNIMVMMELMDGDERIRRVLLSLQTALLAEAEPGADSGGLGLTEAEWGERYGDPASVGDFAVEPSFDGDGWIHTLVATVEGEAVPVDEARALIGSMLPPDAWTADTYSMPALDEAGTVLRVVRWESQQMRELGGGYGSVLAFFPEREEGDGAVTERVVLATMR